MIKFFLFLAFLLSFSFAQTSFLRVWYVATGQPSTPSYFDYDPVTQTVLRMQYLNDIDFVMNVRNNAQVIISAMTSDAYSAFAIITFVVNPNINTVMLNLNQTSCTLTGYPIPLGTGLGLASDPVNQRLFWNYKNTNANVGNATVVPTSGINTIPYAGGNVTSIYTYPTLTSSSWLAFDQTRDRLLTSVSANTISSIQLQTNLLSLTFPTQGCQATTCNVETLGAAVDTSNNRIYYPDASGILTADGDGNTTSRSLNVTNNVVKSVALDNKNGLLFIQMFPAAGQVTSGIFVVSVDLKTGIANPSTFKPVPGAIALNYNAGNVLSVSQCTNVTCSICGFSSVLPTPAGTGALFSLSMSVIVAVIAALLM